MRHCELAVIIPMYNPGEGWVRKLSESADQLKAVLDDKDFSLIVVNDGSTKNVDPQTIEDASRQLCNTVFLSYVSNQGKGYAIRYGMERAEADYYVYTDLDFPFGYRAVRDVLVRLETDHSNLVIGTRDPEYFKVLPIRRRLISRSLRFANCVLTRFIVKDTQAGLKGLDNKAKKVFLSTRVNSFIFELEFIKKCIRQGINCSFIGVSPQPNVRFSDFGLRTIMRELANLTKILLRT